jgi:hypothetical protein
MPLHQIICLTIMLFQLVKYMIKGSQEKEKKD